MMSIKFRIFCILQNMIQFNKFQFCKWYVAVIHCMTFVIITHNITALQNGFFRSQFEKITFKQTYYAKICQVYNMLYPINTNDQSRWVSRANRQSNKYRAYCHSLPGHRELFPVNLAIPRQCVVSGSREPCLYEVNTIKQIYYEPCIMNEIFTNERSIIVFYQVKAFNSSKFI